MLMLSYENKGSAHKAALIMKLMLHKHAHGLTCVLYSWWNVECFSEHVNYYSRSSFVSLIRITYHVQPHFAAHRNPHGSGEAVHVCTVKHMNTGTRLWHYSLPPGTVGVVTRLVSDNPTV